MRLFFAAWPPPEIASALAQWARRLEGRPTPAEKIHLTLAFLGEADADKAAAAARNAQGRAHRLPIEVAKHWKRSDIVWAGPHETPTELSALVESLHFALFRAGFILEPRPFAAHVTLLRKAPRPRSFPPLPAVEWPVGEFVLARSRLSSEGSTYEVFERFALDRSASVE